MELTADEVETILKAAQHLLSHFDKKNPLQPFRTINNFMTLLRESLAPGPLGVGNCPLFLAEEILKIPLEKTDLRVITRARRLRKPRPSRRSLGAT